MFAEICNQQEDQLMIDDDHQQQNSLRILSLSLSLCECLYSAFSILHGFARILVSVNEHPIRIPELPDPWLNSNQSTQP
jgi:hypothetical protein